MATIRKEYLKKILETIKLRVCIFSMRHPMVDLYSHFEGHHSPIPVVYWYIIIEPFEMKKNLNHGTCNFEMWTREVLVLLRCQLLLWLSPWVFIH